MWYTQEMCIVRRAKLYGLDITTCWYCGIKVRVHSTVKGVPDPPDKATLDHRVPLERGGKTRKENLAIACWECNRSKSSKSLEDFRVVLIRQHKISNRKFYGETQNTPITSMPPKPIKMIPPRPPRPGDPVLHPSPLDRLWHRRLRRKIKKLVFGVKERKILAVSAANRASRWFTKDFMELFSGD